jgi:hypothetical protein
MNIEAMRGSAYVIVALGCVLTLATSFVPQATGAHKLSFALLIWGVCPTSSTARSRH